MKKFLKWAGIIIAVIILIIVITFVTIFIRNDRFGIYGSGGPLSENQASFDINYYGLNLQIFAEEQAIAGETEVMLTSLVQGLDKIELDLIDNFDVTQVAQRDGKVIKFEHSDNKLWLFPEPAMAQDSQMAFTIAYNGQPIEAIRPPWVDGFVWSKDENGIDWIGVTSQGDGGKLWFPCKDHPTDEPDSVDLIITIPEHLYCAANGLLQKVSTPKEGFKTYHWRTNYPINNYNININIGDYRILEKPYYSQDSSVVMPVMYYYLPQSAEGAEAHLDMAIDMLYTYRRYFGEYPWIKEKFAIVHTDYLGMEHQTINAYGNHYKYLQMKDGQVYDELMLHEMGHEWWGNKVSVGDWADFWIQEGICVYGEALYMLGKSGEAEYHRHMAKIKNRIANRTPIIQGVDIKSNQAYTGDIYSKGAYFMHSMRYILGDSIFFKTLMDFATEEQFTYNNTVVTDDLVDLVKRNSGQDYSDYFDFYLKSTKLVNVQVDSIGPESYEISLTNIDFELPMEVVTDEGTQRLILSKAPYQVSSKMKPEVDPDDWFLKMGFRNN